MPYSNPVALGIEGLDDPLIFDLCASFAGGMVSNVRSNLLQPNQAALLQNCEISRAGEIITRRGSAKLGAGTAGTGTYIRGITHFETPSYNYPVVCNGTKLYSYDGANWNQLDPTAFAAGATTRMGFAQGINKLYLAELGLGGLYSWDGAALTSLAGALNSSPPPNPVWLTWHTNRLVAVAGPTDSQYPDGIYYSQFLDGATWDRTKWSHRIGAGEGDAITGVYPWTDFNLLVLKRHSIWVVDATPTLQTNNANNDVSGFTVKVVHRRIGCPAPATACQVGSDVFFLSDSGVRSINRVAASATQTEVGDAISLPIQDYIARINLSAIGTSNAIFFDNKYILAVPLDNATSPSHLLVYDVLNQSWSGIWLGWLPTGFAIRNIPSEPGRLIFGQNDGTVSEFYSYIQASNETDTHFKDNGVDVALTLTTRALNFGEPLLRKEGFNCEFEFNRSTAMASCQVIIDDGAGQTFETFQTATTGVALPQILPFVLATAGVVRSSRDLQRYGLFREIQFELTTTAQKLVLRSIAAGGFLNPMEIQRN